MGSGPSDRAHSDVEPNDVKQPLPYFSQNQKEAAVTFHDARADANIGKTGLPAGQIDSQQKEMHQVIKTVAEGDLGQYKDLAKQALSDPEAFNRLLQRGEGFKEANFGGYSSLSLTKGPDGKDYMMLRNGHDALLFDKDGNVSSGKFVNNPNKNQALELDPKSITATSPDSPYVKDTLARASDDCINVGIQNMPDGGQNGRASGKAAARSVNQSEAAAARELNQLPPLGKDEGPFNALERAQAEGTIKGLKGLNKQQLSFIADRLYDQAKALGVPGKDGSLPEGYDQFYLDPRLIKEAQLKVK